MSRSKSLFREGLRESSNWKLGVGALGLVYGFVRRNSRPQPEVVSRVVLRPGDRLLITSREPRKRRRRS